MKSMTMAAMAAFWLATSLPAAGQQQDHQTHHPQGAPAQAAPAQPQTPPRQPGGPGTGMGMMGQGGGMGGPMMGPGMMGGGMMNMHGGMMGMMRGAEHVEGRLAFLRTELKITDAQQKLWSDFADALRANAKRLQEARPPMMRGAGGQQGMGMSGQGGMGMGMMAEMHANPMTHVEHHERWYAAKLESARAIKAPLGALYGALSEEQKRTFAELRPLYMSLL